MRAWSKALVLSLFCISSSPAVADDEHVFAMQSDLGGVGLMQTPTARMSEVGEFSASYSQVEPYSRLSVSLQPFSWLEVGFRYTSINNRPYVASGGDRDYLDKGVDVKLRLLEEGDYLPEVALGFRDFGGTGLFSSEYLVFSKRWYRFDFSVGFATGYVGAGGDINNPLSVIDEQYETRQASAETGEFSLNQLFTGDVGMFGGVAYHTRWDPLILMVEYDGNDYQSEPLGNDQVQDSPINFGVRYRVNDNLTLSAGWERGNTAMLGVSVSLNLVDFYQPKSDPAAVPLDPVTTHDTPDDWDQVTEKLDDNAGIDTSRILKRNQTLIVEGETSTYRSLPEAELRARRILHNNSSNEIKRFKFRWEKAGVYLREDTLPRRPIGQEPFVATNNSLFKQQDYRYSVHSQDVSSDAIEANNAEVLYVDPWKGLQVGFEPDFQQTFGSPAGYLYTVVLELSGRLWTDENGFFSVSLGYDLFGNYDKAEFSAPTGLPPVRTHVVDYRQQTTFGVYNLQYTRTARLSRNLFLMGYAGMLEAMYAGAGAEVLYRPFNSSLAVGLDLNWVKQRAFDTKFDFRDYQTVTGHLSFYWQTGIKNVLAKIHVGRYLAKDSGVTLDLSRRFESGVRIGAWATFTDASDEAYGEGSFDKGIYVSIPWDFFFTESSNNTFTVQWDPLTRDGGARLHRAYTLYGLTSDRDLGPYWHNYADKQ